MSDTTTPAEAIARLRLFGDALASRPDSYHVLTVATADSGHRDVPLMLEDLRAALDGTHRDDLARDVARLWPAFQRTRMNNPEATAESIKVWDELMAAFDRLAAAYGEEP